MADDPDYSADIYIFDSGDNIMYIVLLLLQKVRERGIGTEKRIGDEVGAKKRMGDEEG